MNVMGFELLKIMVALFAVYGFYCAVGEVKNFIWFCVDKRAKKRDNNIEKNDENGGDPSQSD